MSKAFFCYERDMSSQWRPVVYFDEVPKLKREMIGTRSSVWVVGPDEMDDHGEPHFGKLQAKYPAPAL